MERYGTKTPSQRFVALQIVKGNQFSLALDTILDYIARDGIDKAIGFNRKLEKSLGSIANFPYKARKSLYHDDINVRDYIFKGYTIPYFVDKEKETLVLLDIFKWVER